jgi:hypothetical protein
MPDNPRLKAVDELLHDRMFRSRLSLIFTLCGCFLLAGSMLIVRAHGGAREFLDGAVGRGGSLALLFIALPISFKIARLGRMWPVEPGIAVLAHLRGFDTRFLAQRTPWVAAKVICIRTAIPTMMLALFAMLLSLPDFSALGQRLLVGLLLVLLVNFSGITLMLIAIFAARWAKQFAEIAMIAIIFIPWLFAISVPGIPNSASLPGLYAKSQDAIYRTAPKLADCTSTQLECPSPALWLSFGWWAVIIFCKFSRSSRVKFTKRPTTINSSPWQRLQLRTLMRISESSVFSNNPIKVEPGAAANVDWISIRSPANSLTIALPPFVQRT